MLKRAFDLALAGVLGALVFVPCVVIALVIRLTSSGPALYWSDRIGRFNRVFSMPKFRSMFVGTPPLATHLLGNPDAYLTPVGRFLRKTSLDELPQLWSVLKGDMSMVGPRPALFNQHDLIQLRSQYGVDRLRPGITGWAQVNGRDELSVAEKVEFDRQYLERIGLAFDLRILVLTAVRVLRREGVVH
jgi:O-antigen biosynthesis protein WbqP